MTWSYSRIATNFWNFLSHCWPQTRVPFGKSWCTKRPQSYTVTFFIPQVHAINWFPSHLGSELERVWYEIHRDDVCKPYLRRQSWCIKMVIITGISLCRSNICVINTVLILGISNAPETTEPEHRVVTHSQLGGLGFHNYRK